MMLRRYIQDLLLSDGAEGRLSMTAGPLPCPMTQPPEALRADSFGDREARADTDRLAGRF